MKKLLLLSNSTLPGGQFLDFAKSEIRNFLKTQNRKLVFIPYAAVTFSHEDYTDKVRGVFVEMGYSITGIHEVQDPVKAIMESQGIVVGGGNTFHLLHELGRNELIEPIRQAVANGIPYLSWSAGSNLACPTIKTTNDMPIIDLPSLRALDLIPFQINPHYTDGIIPNHSGESRMARILEFLEVNPEQTVVGLPEGALLKWDHNHLFYNGSKPALIFRKGKSPEPINPGRDISNLLGSQP